MIRKEQIDLIKSGKISIRKPEEQPEEQPEEKSFSVYGGGATLEQSLSSTAASQMLVQPFSMAGRFGWMNVRAAVAWQYYKEISVIRDAVDLGADGFVTVPLGILDTQTEEILTEFNKSIPATGVLSLLEKPNQDKSESEFKKAHYTTYQVTGDTFFLTTSVEEDSEPLEIYPINSKNVSSTENADEITTMYQITAGKFRGTYQRVELPDDRIIYTNKDGNLQLWVMKTFNPDSYNDGRGLSKLSSVFYEIEQHAGTSKHNTAILNNGVRASGAVIPHIPEGQTTAGWTDEQIQNIKSQIQSYYGGPNNAGNVMVLDGIKEFKELSMNNKDMEFMELLKMMKQQIYNNLRIPLPLVTGDIMTFSNFAISEFLLYSMNIVPFATCYADELNRFLMPRFDDSGRYKLVVNLDKIPALELRKLEKINLFRDVLTVDEARAILGKPEHNDPLIGNQLLRKDGGSGKPAAEATKSRDDFMFSLMDRGCDHSEAKQKTDDLYGSN